MRLSRWFERDIIKSAKAIGILLVLLLLGTLVLRLSFYPPAHAQETDPIIFSDGFESGDGSAWNRGSVIYHGTQSFVSSPVHSGNWAMECQITSPGWGWSVVYAQWLGYPTLYFRAYVQVTALPAEGEDMMMVELESSDENAIASLGLGYSGDGPQWMLYYMKNGASSYSTLYAGTPTVNKWYFLEVMATVDASNGAVKGYVDGSLLMSDSGFENDYHGQATLTTLGFDTWTGQDYVNTGYFDDAVVSTHYVGPESAPTFGSISTSTTVAGTSCSFNCLVSDDTNYVSTFIFSTNNTGAWVNDTDVAFSSSTTAAWANTTKTLDGTVGDVVSYIWYTNDTSNNWGISDQYDVILTSPTPNISILSPQNTTYTTANVILNFTINEAVSWMGYSLDGQNNITINGSITLTGLSNGPHQVIVYANDSYGTMGSSQTVYFTVESTGLTTFNQTGIGSDYTGTVVTIDGINYTANNLPQTFTWDVGSEHTFSCASPLTVNAGKQYVWLSTAGLSTLQSDTIVVPAASGTLTASYGTQYYLNVSSPYGTVGGNGWYNSDTTAYANLTTGTVDQLNQTRRVFTTWSGDASGTNYAQSHPITMNAALTAIANWETQYQVNFTVAPSSHGTTSPTGTNWYNEGPPGIAITANSNNISYEFIGWSTTGNISFANQFQRSTVATINGPGTITANFELNTEQITINSNPEGLGLVNVDGTNYTTPQTFTWTVGDTHTLEAFSPVPGPAGTRYIFANWSDSGSQTHVFTVPASTETVTANYNTQFQITFNETGVEADFTRTVVTVDGVDYSLSNLPISFFWTSGSTHAFTFASPLVVNASKQYTWTSTLGLSNRQSDTISITGPGSITGNFVTVIAPDVAVTGIACPKTVVGKGYSMNVTVTASNLRTTSETFNITVYANTTIIASQNVTLQGGNSANFTLTSDTTNLAYGNYTLSAYAWPVPGETNIANNNFAGGSVVVSIPGDVTGPNGVPDGKVDIRDVHYVARLYDTTSSSPNWNANADINNDGKVDIRDVHIAAARVSIPGDVTGPNGVPDGKVDIRDVHYVARLYDTTSSSPNWNENADINNDGKVDIRDVHIAAANYGQHLP